MKIWSNILLASLLLMVFTAAAQQAPKRFKEKSDPEARKILKKLGDTYQTEEGVFLEYQLVLEFGQNKEIQVGNIYQKGKNYHVNNNGNEIICNGSSVWVYNKKQNEVQINDYEEDEEVLSPTKILNIYKAEKEYFYAITGADSKGYRIEFKPLDVDSEIMKIRIAVDKSKTVLKSVKIFGDDGGRYTFNIKSLKNKKISSSQFKFDKAKYPGVKVIDLRD